MNTVLLDNFVKKNISYQEWKKKDALQRLCMMRAMRPDRMTYAVQSFIEEKLGSRFVESRSVEFAKSFEESGRFSTFQGALLNIICSKKK